MMIYIVVVLLILYVYLTTLGREGFAVIQTEDTLLTKVYKNENIYDNLYTFVYDDVVLSIPYSVELIKFQLHWKMDLSQTQIGIFSD